MEKRYKKTNQMLLSDLFSYVTQYGKIIIRLEEVTMKFMNPWENVEIQMLKSPSHLQNYDHRIHIIYVLSGEVELRDHTTQITLPVNGFFILPNASSYDVVFSSANCYEFSLWYHFYDEMQYEYEFEGECSIGGEPPDEELTRLINQLLELFYLEKDSCSDVELLHLYFSILHVLERKYYKKKPLTKRERSKTDIEEIKYFIDNNYDRELHLSDLAKQLYVSEQYLSRIFTKQIGTSISNYLQKKRLEKVEHELIYTSKSITDIVYGAGFDNINSFNRIFKRIYQESPSMYRRHHQKVEEPTESITLDHQVVDLIKKNVETKTDEEELVVSLQTFTKREKAELIMNVQNPEVLLKKKYIDQLMQLQHDIHVQYLRFFVTFAEHRTMEWYDELFEMIGSLHCIPFISIDPFEKDMESNLKVFFNYFLHRYGRAAIGLWKVELLCTTEHAMSAMELQKFTELQQVCTTLIPAIHVGIGNIPLVLSTEQKETMISYIRNCKQELAFIGCVARPVIRKGSVYQGRKSIYQFSKRDFLSNHIKEFIEILHAHGLEKPLYLTEFALTSTNTDPLNDSTFLALYICKLHLQFSKYFEMIGYCSCSDLDQNTQGKPDEFCGNPGLFTQHGIPKCSYYAYQFLEELKEDILYENENIIITRNQVGDLAVLGYLYSEIDSAYSYYRNDEEALHHMQVKGLNAALPRKIQLVLSELSEEKATYALTAEKIGTQYGNALDEWMKVTSITDLSNEAIQYLMQKSVPTKYFKTIITKNGSMSVKLYIEANQLVLLKLKRMN